MASFPFQPHNKGAYASDDVHPVVAPARSTTDVASMMRESVRHWIGSKVLGLPSIFSQLSVNDVPHTVQTLILKGANDRCLEVVGKAQVELQLLATRWLSRRLDQGKAANMQELCGAKAIARMYKLECGELFGSIRKLEEKLHKSEKHLQQTKHMEDSIKAQRQAFLKARSGATKQFYEPFLHGLRKLKDSRRATVTLLRARRSRTCVIKRCDEDRNHGKLFVQYRGGHALRIGNLSSKQCESTSAVQLWVRFEPKLPFEGKISLQRSLISELEEVLCRLWVKAAELQTADEQHVTLFVKANKVVSIVQQLDFLLLDYEEHKDRLLEDAF